MTDSTNRPVAQSKERTLPGPRDLFSRFGTLCFFLILLSISAFITPNFLAFGTLENILVQVFPVMIVALGMTLVISSGGIDISVGAIMAISAAVFARLYMPEQEGLVTAIFCAVAAACLCGLLNGLLIAKCRIQPIIVTLVVMITGRGMAQIILGEPVTSLFLTQFADFGSYRVGGEIPVQIVVMIVLVAIMFFVVKKTVFAKRVEAIGDNCRAARLVGINTVLVTVGVYVLCGLLCSIAGLMAAARVTGVNAASLGLLVELDAIAAVAIGGTAFSGGRARILGTVFGAIVVQLVTVIANMNEIPVHYSLIFKALILIIVLFTQRKK